MLPLPQALRAICYMSEKSGQPCEGCYAENAGQSLGKFIIMPS